ncbi:MAG: uroporphyrinogen-III synthase, partial [Candidatus Omnitrophota bacterium]
KESSRIDWEKISTGLGTLVFLMGVENLKTIVKNLLKSGRSPLSPCCLIQNGTLTKQKTVSTTLNKIIKAAKASKFRPPSVLIVGEVVLLRKKLNWLKGLPALGFQRLPAASSGFQRLRREVSAERRAPQVGLPLFGKRILITRPKDEDCRFSQILEESGAECAKLPAIAIKPLKDYSQLDTAIKDITKFQWLIFSSQNGVRFFKQRMDILAQQTGKFLSLSFPGLTGKSRFLDSLLPSGPQIPTASSGFAARRAPLGERREASNAAGFRENDIKIAAIGPRTASALEALSLTVSLQPKEFCQEGLLKSFGRLKLKSQNILIINALEARDVLARGLEKMGAKVITAHAYQTIKNQRSKIKDQKLNNIDIITFTSALAAKNFFGAKPKKTFRRNLTKTIIASIGPITSRAIRTAGLEVNIEAKEYTLEGLAKAIIKYYKLKSKNAKVKTTI